MKTKRQFSFITWNTGKSGIENNGITILKQLSKYNEKEVLNFHGMGKSTIPEFQKLLTNKELTFNISDL